MKEMPMESPSSLFMEKLRLGRYESWKEADDDFRAYSSYLTQYDLPEAHALLARMKNDERIARNCELIDLVPRGWFREYLGLAVASESPISFHFLCGLALFSHVIGRRVWTSFYGSDVFAPESAFIVSPAGLARRSDAINAMCRVAECSTTANLLKDQPTPEALISYLSDNPHTMLVATEAAALLNGSEYMEQFPQFLCQILDCESRIGMVRQKKTTIVLNATANAIFSAAPAWFESMPKAALGGGLLSRVILVYEHDKEKSVPFPGDIMPIPILRARQKKLGVDLDAATKGFTGMLSFPSDLKERYISFYNEAHNSQRNASSKMSHWYGRKAAHFQKLLMSFLCAQGKGLEVDSETFESVEAVLEVLERKMDFGYRHTSSDKHERQRQTILDQLDKRNGEWIDRTTLFQKTSWLWKNAKEFDEVLETLGETGLKEIETHTDRTKRRARLLYRRIHR